MKTVLMALVLSITTSNAFAKSSVSLVRVFKSERRLELVPRREDVAVEAGDSG